MPTLDEIRESIEARITELRNEMTSLESARTALRDESVTRTRTTTAAAVRRAKRRSRRNSPSGVSDGRARTPPGNIPADSPPAAGTAEPSTKASGTSRKPRRRAESNLKTGKPVEVLPAGKLEAMLRESDDALSASTIAMLGGASANQVRGLLRDLESRGQVRRTGTRRTTRWRLVTDEERIAERAAELERRTAARS